MTPNHSDLGMDQLQGILPQNQTYSFCGSLAPIRNELCLSARNSISRLIENEYENACSYIKL